MKIDPRQIPEEGLELTGSLPLTDYDIPIGEIRGWNVIHYRFQARKVGPEVTITGTLSANFETPCARCLDFIPWELKINDFCQVLAAPDEALLDLTPLIREDIILALPLAARCELDGAGRCLGSGKVIAFPRPDDFAEKRRATVWRDLDQLKTEN